MKYSIVLLCALLSGFALAGGWSVVSIEKWPESPGTDSPVDVNFAVRAHGVTLVEGLTMTVIATHVDSGLLVREVARETKRGYFTASLEMPRAGTWQWRIDGYGEHPMPDLEVGGTGTTKIDRGALLFIAKGCVTCHHNQRVHHTGQSLQVGPDLTDYRADVAYLERWLANPKAINPASTMPDLELSKDEIEELVRYLSRS